MQIGKTSEGSILCYYIAIFEKVSHTILVNLLLNENIFIRYGLGVPVCNLCVFTDAVCFVYNLTHRSSRPEVFCKNRVLRNFAKFTGKHLCQSLSFDKVASLRPKQTF